MTSHKPSPAPTNHTALGAPAKPRLITSEQGRPYTAEELAELHRPVQWTEAEAAEAVALLEDM